MVIVKVKLQRISSKKQLLVQFIFIQPILSYFQRQPYRGVLKKRYSGNMLQNYTRTPKLKRGFNRVALQLNWNCTSTWVFSCEFAAYFSEHLFIKAHMDGCFYISNQPIIVFPSKHLLKENNLLCKLKPAEKFIFFQQSLLK